MSTLAMKSQTTTQSGRVWVAAVLLIVAGGALLNTSCGRGERVEPESTPAPEVFRPAAPNKTNIVLITIDTLRSDRVSAYGSDRVDTPNIDSFAEEGVLFTNAASTVPFTLPAHVSIMTGLYPPAHGIRENVGYVLEEDIPTLAETLSRAGWSTAGFVSAFVLDRRWGIGRGFDHYFDDFDLGAMETANMGSVQRSGDVTIDQAVGWLDVRPEGSPFFLWLHLYDPHDPYTPPEPFKSKYPNRPYDGEAAYTDSLIGEFRRALEERNLLDDSLVVLTADHGEGLGDHGEAFHGFFVYDTTIHVPLIVRLPFAEAAGDVVGQAVSHVDLVPTILATVGMPTEQEVHGKNLLPVIAGDDVDLDRGVYSESLYPLLHYGWSPLRSFRSQKHKLISAPRPEVFDMRSDRLERHDLSRNQPELAREMEARLANLRSSIERDDASAGAAPDIDAQTLAQLQALGYAAGQGGVDLDDEEDRPRADPKDKIRLHQTMMAAQSQMQTDREGAKKNLRRVLGEDPEILDAHHMLGELSAVENLHEDALGHFRRALELSPDHERSLMGMASSYRALGRLDEALVGFRRVVEVAGNHTRASVAIADIEFGRGNLDEAAQVLDGAAETTELPALIHNKLGEIRVEQGRADEAIALFKAAISENEKFPTPHFNLAVLIEERGQVQAAVSHYEQAIELGPTYHQAQFNLGRLVGRLGQVDRKQELWEASIESEPDFVQGYYYLAKLMMDRGQDLGRAEELVRRGIELDPEHEEGPLGYYVLADILNRTGRRTEAMDAVATGQRIQAEMK